MVVGEKQTICSGMLTKSERVGRKQYVFYEVSHY